MKFWGIIGSIVLSALLLPAHVSAGPLEEASAMVKEGKSLLAKAKRTRRSKRKELLIRGAGKYARAYLILTTGKAPAGSDALLAEVKANVAELSARPELVAERQATRVKAIKAAAEGRLTDAYDLFARLRDMDPRDQSIEYILGVIGQRMDSGRGSAQ